jgi:hypothetical protein
LFTAHTNSWKKGEKKQEARRTRAQNPKQALYIIVPVVVFFGF